MAQARIVDEMIRDRGRPEAAGWIRHRDHEATAVGIGGYRGVLLETEAHRVWSPPLDVHGIESRPTVFPRGDVHQGALVEQGGIGHSGAMTSQALGHSARRRNSPDVHVVGRNPMYEIGEAAVGRPGRIVIVDAWSGDVDLPRVAPVPIGNEDRIAGVGRVVEHTASVRRPGHRNPILQEGARPPPIVGISQTVPSAPLFSSCRFW